MSEILICYDHNGGYYVKDHYQAAPVGRGRSVEEAMENFIRRHGRLMYDGQNGHEPQWTYFSLGATEKWVQKEWPDKKLDEAFKKAFAKVAKDGGWVEQMVCPCCGEYVDKVKVMASFAEALKWAEKE